MTLADVAALEAHHRVDDRDRGADRRRWRRDHDRERLVEVAQLFRDAARRHHHR